MNNKEEVYTQTNYKQLYIVPVLKLDIFVYVHLMLLGMSFPCVCSSRIGDVDDLPDIRVDASSPGPRVTFNIQDTVNLFLQTSSIYHMLIKQRKL